MGQVPLKITVLTLLILVAAGCAQTGASTLPARYPAQVRDTFLTSCEGQGTPKACECVLDYLERHMTYGEFLALDAAGAEAVQSDDRVKTAVAMCLS